MQKHEALDFHLESRPCPKCGATMLYDEGEPWDGPTWGCTGCGNSENAVTKADPAADARKPCTCDGAGRGPGRACVVKAGGRLGELWRCSEGKAERVHALVNDGSWPEMSEAFDAHMGAACWTDPAYRQDAATWAAAWKAAFRAKP